MKAPLTWEDLRREALNLEIRVDVQDGHVFFCQCGSGERGRFEENLVGCQAAAAWLAAIRRTIDVRDQLRSVELPRRRRMSMRYLWRR
jgi:hypothetical protein